MDDEAKQQRRAVIEMLDRLSVLEEAGSRVSAASRRSAGELAVTLIYAVADPRTVRLKAPDPQTLLLSADGGRGRSVIFVFSPSGLTMVRMESGVASVAQTREQFELGAVMAWLKEPAD